MATSDVGRTMSYVASIFVALPFRHMCFDPALARLFSGSHLYCTTPMPNWRVEQHSRLAYGHIRVQQVRNYEASGLIPQAQRSPSGYRLYTQQHLAALQTVKSMARGYGWQRTSAIMQALHRGDLSAALATIDERHAALARKRLQMEQTLSALRTFAAGSDSLQ